MKRITSLMFLLIILNAFSLFASAQRGEASINYSLIDYNPAKSIANNRIFNGGGGSVGINFSHFLTLKGEFQGYATSTFTWTIPSALIPGQLGTTTSFSTQANMFTYLFGPQVNIPIHQHVRVFGEALFGGAHTNGYANLSTATGIVTREPSNNGFAMAIGGGFDIKVRPHIAIRPGQFDYFLTRYQWPVLGINNQSNFRYQAGLVFPF